MSRAFVKEQDDIGPDAPPELRVSHHPNLVTPGGLKLIEDRLAELGAALAAHPDEAAAAWLRRDLRYWSARHASARVTGRPADEEEVTFGSRVTFRRSGRTETVEIVGEDEADPAAGRIAWVAPLAAVLIGAIPGETVALAGRELEIVAVEAL